MKKIIYPAIFEAEKDGGYSIMFPDLKGCYSEGDSLLEAYYMAKDALALYVFDLDKDGVKIPEASDPQKVIVKGDAFLTLIEFDLIGYQKNMIINL